MGDSKMREIHWLSIRDFTPEEFECPCCNQQHMDMRLIHTLQRIRDHHRRPMVITSGWRCEAHNQAVGGAVRSQHRHGLAADIACDDGRLRADLVFAMFNQLGTTLHGGNIGMYARHVHLGVCHYDEHGQPMVRLWSSS